MLFVVHYAIQAYFSCFCASARLGASRLAELLSSWSTASHICTILADSSFSPPHSSSNSGSAVWEPFPVPRMGQMSLISESSAERQQRRADGSGAREGSLPPAATCWFLQTPGCFTRAPPASISPPPFASTPRFPPHFLPSPHQQPCRSSPCPSRPTSRTL